MSVPSGSRLAKAASASLIIRITSMGLNVLIAIVLARTLTLSDFGLFSIAVVWINCLVLIATIGSDKMIVQRVASYLAMGKFSHVQGLVWSALGVVLVASLSIAALGYTLYVFRENESQLYSIIVWVLVIVPLVAATRVFQSLLQGAKYVVWSQLVESMFRQVIMLLFIAVFITVQSTLSAASVLGVYALAAVINLMAAALVTIKIKIIDLMAKKPHFEHKTWVKGCLFFFAISALQLVNVQTDIMLLGYFQGTEAAGVYAVATKGAEIIAVIVIAGGVVLSPIIAELFTRGEFYKLERLVVSSTIVATIIATMIAVVGYIFRHEILRFFGPEFAAAEIAFSTLMLFRVVYTAGGFVGLVLFMTGNEKWALRAFLIGASTNIILNMILIPIYSIEGAAVATGMGYVVLIFACGYYVRKRLNISSTLLGLGVIQKRRNPAI